jgi:uncharacterized membrane protein
MTTLLKTFRVIAFTLWIGGLAFFAFAVAPAAFHILPTPDLAASIIRATLHSIHIIGLIAAAVIILTTLLLSYRRTAVNIIALAAAMSLITAYSQFCLVPRMQQLRAQAGEISPTVPCANADCTQFMRLHKRSEHMEGLVLLGGVALAALLSRHDA